MPDIDYVIPPVPATAKPDRVCGTILLSFRDAVYQLNMTSEEGHVFCPHPSPYSDGLFDFDAADYNAQRDALLRMLSVGKSCEMVFRVEAYFADHEESESLYFAKIHCDRGACFAEVDPYYMDPTGRLNAYADGLDLSGPSRARQMYDLLFGGFVAAEIDHMDNAWSHEDRMNEVFFFRRALEHARESDGLLSVVTQETKRPLATQIQSAQNRTTSADKPAGEKTHNHTNERG